MKEAEHYAGRVGPGPSHSGGPDRETIADHAVTQLLAVAQRDFFLLAINVVQPVIPNVGASGLGPGGGMEKMQPAASLLHGNAFDLLREIQLISAQLRTG